MPKSVSAHKDFARSAALETAPRDGVGAFIEQIDEGESVFTYRFESKLKGYRDWRWNVVVFAPEGAEPTVSEVLLMPSETSLIAPDWVPWSERLADYRALQAELEAQAALEAEEDDEDEDEEALIDSTDSEDLDESEDSGELNNSGEESNDSENREELALSDADQADEAKDDAKTTGKRPKRLFGWRKARVGKKNSK
jgi:hypothetical protein